MSSYFQECWTEQSKQDNQPHCTEKFSEDNIYAEVNPDTKKPNGIGWVE